MIFFNKYNESETTFEKVITLGRKRNMLRNKSLFLSSYFNSVGFGKVSNSFDIGIHNILNFQFNSF